MLTYSCDVETGLLVCEIYPNLLVREDGMVKNTRGHGGSNKKWFIGGVNKDGYPHVGIPGIRKSEKVHRLVALAFLGNPENLAQVDHKNGVRDDNRLENLRWVTRRGNGQNQITHRNGRLAGATMYKGRSTNPWMAQCKVNRKHIHIGYYATELEAHGAYLDFLRVNGLS